MQSKLIEGYRLSPQQRAAWPARLNAALECSVELSGAVDEQRLWAAIRRVMAHHKILRSRFWTVAGLDYPLQQIQDEASPELASFALERHAPRRQALRITLSPLCGDAATVRLLVREIRDIYDGAEPAEEPLQYIQYAEWLSELAGEEGADEGRRFWAERKASAVPLVLPGERNAGNGAVARVEQLIEGADVGTLAGRLRAPLITVLCGSWALQLWRRTGTTPITIYNLFPCRKYPELQSALGPFARSLPVPIEVRAAANFGTLVAKITADLEESEKWEEYYSDDGRDAAIGFEYREVDSPSGNWRIENLRTWTEGPKLKLVCEWDGARIRTELWYDEARYDRHEIEWLSEGFAATLRSAAATRRLQELDVIGPAERAQLMEWSSGGPAVQRPQTIAERFTEIAEANPDCIALVDSDEHFSYGALHQRASQIAGSLQRAGVEVEDVVGLNLERSAEQWMAMLGILQSGGTYTVLDADWPWARQEQVARELGLRVVISSGRWRESWEELGLQVVDPAAGPESVSEWRAQSGEHLAYVLYTSGSTGRAKGVMVRQSSVIELWSALRERVYEGAAGGLRIGLNASLSFDAAVKQWVQWLSGDRLEVVPEGVRGDGASLRAWLVERGIEWVDATPSQWQWVEQAGGVRTRVLLGGEAVPETLWRQVAEQGGGWNVYGPTECTVDATAARIEGSRVVIGRPLAGMSVFVLDAEGRLAPAGVAGEISIGGTGVARGYAKQPGWTAERWRPDAVSGAAGGRLYRTGDIGRYGRDGELEYLRREDGQLKLRGYRVELGEIEGILREHAWVREAAVTVRREGLVAYVALEGGGEQGRVRHRLPNGLEILAHSRVEAAALYREIFVEGTYSRHGIAVPEKGVVIDAGANIGMFTLWVCEQSGGARVWALEPVEAVARTLRRNVARYGERVKVLREGLADGERWERFTYYRGAPALSGMSRYADEAADRAVVERVTGRKTEELESQEEMVRVRTLASLLRDERLERVDLLKVDVQRAEWEVLQGIGAEEWAKIGQIVLEVHRDVERVVRLLELQGFGVWWEQEAGLAGSDRYNVYGRQAAATEVRSARRPAGTAAGQAEVSVKEALRRHVRERAPEYMTPAAVVVLERLPLTRSGKVDRAALPEPNTEQEREEEGYRSATEEIVAGIWAEVLGRERVGRQENFFELGGHSLVATQVMARVRKALGVELALRTLFETPTVAGLSRRVEQAGAAEPEPALERVPREGPLPASYGQQRLWFLQQMEPESAYYNCPGAVRLRGALDEAALERSLRAIVERHEVLRTRYQMQDGELRQVVGSAAEFVLERELLRGSLEEWLEAEARRPFDLGRDLPVRARLLRVSEQEWVLALTLHHIAADGWSMGVVVRELNAHYRGERLPELRLQYGDYVVWERGRRWERSLAYWKERLSGLGPALELAADHARPGVRSYAGGRERIELSEELSGRVGAVSRRYGASEYMTLLAALMVVLWRYSGQKDIAVGTALGGREREELEGLIGLFINTMVVRAEVEGSERFEELLGRVKEEVLEGQRHGGVPFERVVEAVAPERSLGHGPLVQVMFLYEGQTGGSVRLGEVESEGLEVETGTAKFDVTLGVSRVGGRLSAVWEYSRELWEAETARRMLESWVRVVEGAVGEPGRRLRELEWVGEAERRQVLEEWNRTEREIAGEGNVVWWVEREAETRPDGIAVEAEGGEQISYGELNRRANGLAKALRGVGIGQEERVGVCIERGVGMVVGLLGVLKAGGAYVPLEPGLPGARLRWMLGDTGARVVVVDEAAEAALGEWAGIRLRAEEEREEMNPGVRIDGEQLAYVIYTSGSTGQPKGVAVPHRAIVNCFAAFRQLLDIDPNAEWIALTSLGFDIAVLELLFPLTAGARIRITSIEQLITPGSKRVLHSAPVIVQTTPHNWEVLVRTGIIPRSTKALCGGEALPRQLARHLAQTTETAWNVYGPTETTIWSTSWQIDSDRVSIGRPILNTQIYILDRDLEPLHIGVPGEIYIGGHGVVRGYWGRPDLTAERFVPDLFAREAGARMYCTGDRGRWLADGTIEYLGRHDAQVKLRGARIEPGEIEAAITAHPAVAACVVKVSGNSSDNARLVAYVIPRPGTTVNASDVRHFVLATVPGYMVPSAIIALERFPLTPNGKIDRSALPLPIAERHTVEPRNSYERELVRIWGELLDGGAIGIEDNLFELGGHSLLATQFVARVAERFDVEIPLRTVFERPTVADLALAILEAEARQLDGAQLAELLQQVEAGSEG